MSIRVERICPFCNKYVEFINDFDHVGFVTQKNIGFSVRQYFHLKCFEKAGRHDNEKV